MEDQVTTRCGAVLMMDTLGFKGIWKKSTHGTVLSKLRHLEKVCHSKIEELNRDGGISHRQITLQVTILSDTIVIAASAPGASKSPTRGDDPILLLGAAAASAAIIEVSASTDPIMIYRGVLTWGEFEMDDRFLIGQPIDEAAQLERNAEAAVVWLAPSAVAVLRASKLELDELGFVRWPVPMKNGGAYETSVVNPFHWLSKAEDATRRDRLEWRILSAFDGPVDIQIKRQNTERYLRVAKERAAK